MRRETERMYVDELWRRRRTHNDDPFAGRANTMSMLAISVRQPWSWLITNNLKDIENRESDTDRRGEILIHAGRQPDGDAWDRVSQRFLPVWHRMGIVLPDAIDVPDKSCRMGGIVGVATLVDVVRQSSSPWFVGPYGWVLRDARPLPFTPLRGYPVPFTVNNEAIERRVRQREDHASYYAARTIYTIGYRTDGTMRLLLHLASQGCPIIDCRYWPWSKVPVYQQFDADRLSQVLGLYYLPMFSLGNKNFNKPGPIELVDQEAGILNALCWLESIGKVCLLCGCPDPAQCHREMIANLLLERSKREAPQRHVHIVHLQATQFLPGRILRPFTPPPPRSRRTTSVSASPRPVETRLETVPSTHENQLRLWEEML